MSILAAVLSAMTVLSCSKTGTDPVVPDTDEARTLHYVNSFLANTMKTFYLWTDEVSSGIASWKDDDDPEKKVLSVRYKDASGRDIDRWTRATSDYQAMVDAIDGNGKTYGFHFTLYRRSISDSSVMAVVTVVYPGSPAAEAGLKRGDAIMSVNGRLITMENYQTIATKELAGSDSCRMVLSDGKTLVLNAKAMYEDPVLISKVFDIGSKRVGYLLFNSFTLDSCQKLIDICTDFKALGVSELVLDLRYNGGGYVFTEEVLASMLAPLDVVISGCVFEREIYNATLSKFWQEDAITCFKQTFQYTSGSKEILLSTVKANIGLDKIYAITTGSTASASESILTGLKPYMPVETVGEQSYGKYCTGIIYKGTGWYDDNKNELSLTDYTNGKRYVGNWAIYIMVGRYADKDGNTPCMPDGFIPDVVAHDTPYDGIPLGDEKETMLRKALERAGKVYSPTAAPRMQSITSMEALQLPVSGYRIKDLP